MEASSSGSAGAGPRPRALIDRIAWPALLSALWAAGLVALLSRMALGLWRMERLVRRAGPAGGTRVQDLAAEIGRELGLARPVRLMLSARIGSPVTWGWLRPVVLLPSDAAEWPADRLRVVLLHELIHVRRLHWPWQILAAAAAALHWFNPLVWLAIRRLEIEREMACDEGVIEHGTRASDYATHLVEIARAISVAKPRADASPAVSLSLARSLRSPRFGRPTLERRLVMILKPRKRAFRGRLAALPLAALAVAILPVAALQLRAEPADAEAVTAASALEPPAASAARTTGAVGIGASESGATLTAGDFVMSTGVGTSRTRSTGESGATLITGNFVMSTGIGTSRSRSADGAGSARSERTRTSNGFVMSSGNGTMQFNGHGNSFFIFQQDVDGVDLQILIEDPDGVELTRDGRDVASMDPDSRIAIKTAYEGSHQRLEIRPDGRHGMTYEWSIDGRRSEFDADAREWMGLTLRIASNLREAGQLRGRHSSLRGQISSVKGHVSSLKGRISSVKGHRSSLDGRISSIRGHVSSLKGRIASIRGHEASLRGRIASLNGRIHSLRAQKARISSSHNASRRAIAEDLNADIDREIEEIQGDIREVEAELDEYDGDGRVREVERELEDYDAESLIAEVERELESFDVDGQVRSIEREIEEYDAEGRVRELEEEIRRLEPLERADEATRRAEELYPDLRRAVSRVGRVSL